MIEPEGYKVVVRPERVEEKTDGGIILPDTVKDMEQRGAIRGTIVAIGPSADVKFKELLGENQVVGKDEKVVIEGDKSYWVRPAHIGDKVLYARYGGFVVEEDGEEFRILNDDDIIGLIV